MSSQKILNVKDFISHFPYEAPESMTFAIINQIKSEVIYYQSTNKPWESFYYNSALRKYCHIMRDGVAKSKQSKAFSVIWNTVPIDNQESLYINIRRRELHHSNGISICETIRENLIFCALLSGNYEDVNFVSRIISHKQEILLRLFKQNRDFLENCDYIH